ncbi:hypothetical protein, partial [Escherichia coli]|uniref:hypothetical protein n=1 Tax=Escherichia coli TaxID=562 RepID=UPI002148F227
MDIGNAPSCCARFYFTTSGLWWFLLYPYSENINLTDKTDSLWISEMRLRVVPGFISPPPGFGGFCYTP